MLRKDSIDLTHEDRSRILHHVIHTTHTCIIITHGTDAMTLTAQALAAIPNKPSCLRVP